MMLALDLKKKKNLDFKDFGYISLLTFFFDTCTHKSTKATFRILLEDGTLMFMYILGYTQEEM